jgi:hypothetical protein
VSSRSASATGSTADGTRFDITFYREFPGSEDVLADQGRAFLPLQFPGLLLGKDITDVCVAGGESCDYLTTFDRERVASALRPTRMVLDACLATAARHRRSGRPRGAALSPRPGPDASPAGYYHSATGASGTTAEDDRGCVVVPAAARPRTTSIAATRPASSSPPASRACCCSRTARDGMLNDLKLPACTPSGGHRALAPSR